MTEQLIKKVVLPTDRSKAWGIEYEVEPPDYGEAKGKCSFRLFSFSFSLSIRKEKVPFY